MFISAGVYYEAIHQPFPALQRCQKQTSFQLRKEKAKRFFRKVNRKERVSYFVSSFMADLMTSKAKETLNQRQKSRK